MHAFDYLLKPYEDARFRETLSRAKEQLSREEAARLGEQLRAKAVEAGLVSAPSSRIVVRDRGRIIFLEAEEIDWIESADYYVELHVGARTYLHRESMAALENRLDSARFVRIHRTAIVNRRVLRELRRTGSGGLVAVLATGAELPVARQPAGTHPATALERGGDHEPRQHPDRPPRMVAAGVLGTGRGWRLDARALRVAPDALDGAPGDPHGLPDVAVALLAALGSGDGGGLPAACGGWSRRGPGRWCCC